MARGLYALTVFLGAFLLFLVQPLFGKVVLPWFGGSPGTWTTCMLAFQSLLLAGYLCAHGAARLQTAAQVVAFLFAIVAGALMLPVLPDTRPDPGAAPLPQLLGLLAVHAALPFIALSATTPLVSSWYARRMARDPYALYAFSNAGSMLGLLGYPFLVEPSLDLSGQAALWDGLFLGWGLCVAGCGALAWRGGPAPVLARAEPAPGPGHAAARPGLWLALACVPSVMLLAVTNHITVDVAAVPFLWVLPLSLYLLSFILVFGTARFYRRGPFFVAWVVATAALALALLREAHSALWLQLGGALAVLFLCCMICHGELSRLRPAGERVTHYYLWMSAGGAVGGLLVAVIAPLVFVGFFELHLAIIATYALALYAAVDAREALLRQRQRRDALRRLGLGFGMVVPMLIASVWLQLFGSGGETQVLERRRGFHGTLRVTRLPRVTMLTHGRISHGMEFRDPARRAQPTMYYGAASGAGIALAAHAIDRPRTLGVVGLGVGTLAAFGRPNDVLRFYELSPDVVELARTRFGFLERCRAKVEISLGDARLSMEQQASQGFDLLLLDAFSSDAVPIHLLTVEAFAIYLRHLAPDGLLLVNVSNRYLDVERAVAGSAAAHGLTMRLVESRSDVERGWARVRWAVLARNAQTLDPILEDAPTAQLSGEPVVWRDRYSDLLSVLR